MVRTTDTVDPPNDQRSADKPLLRVNERKPVDRSAAQLREDAVKLRDAPGLSRCTHGVVGRVTVEDLRHLPQTALLKVALERRQHRPATGTNGIVVAVDAPVSVQERPHQPRPHRPLVVGGVAIGRSPAVSPDVARLARRERTKAIRREELALDDVDDLAALLEAEEPEGEAHGEDLVRAEARVLVRVTDHVEQEAALGVPELRERERHAIRLA